jgi:hypothetical protein
MKDFHIIKYRDKAVTIIVTFFFFTLLILSAIKVSAQQPVGRIFDQVRMQSFVIYDNDFIIQDANPVNRGQAVRDPSGYMYLMMPSTTPNTNAFFIDWNNKLVQVDRINGVNIIGYCQCPLPINPYANIYQPPQYNEKVGVQTPNGFRPLPNKIVDVSKPYGNIMITSEQRALECYEQSLNIDGTLNRDRFGNCMIQNLAGNKELEILNCVKNSKNSLEQTICMIGILGGDREKQISQKLLECYNAYGTDYSKYTLCLAGTTADPELAKLISCIEQQSRTGQVTFINTAVCYGVQNLNLNPETQIILECAIASGGEPYTFASCAGGQLLARELDKCLTYGVGGSKGCFGKNNDIIKGLAAIGQALNIEFGPNNYLTKTWNSTVNDIKNGPGENHEAVKTIRNVSNEIEKANNNVKREIKKIVPKIKITL